MGLEYGLDLCDFWCVFAHGFVWFVAGYLCLIETVLLILNLS